MRPFANRFETALIGLLVLSATPAATAQDPWPAEPLALARNLTGIEGPEPNEFHDDLSGAAWNPETRTLWLCRNGAAVYWLSFLIGQSQLATREKLLQLELRLAEMAAGAGAPSWSGTGASRPIG